MLIVFCRGVDTPLKRHTPCRPDGNLGMYPVVKRQVRFVSGLVKIKDFLLNFDIAG